VARPGEEIRNGRGERLVFRTTAAESGGERLEYDVFFRPDGLGAQEHLHPKQEERHEILAGELGLVVTGREEVLGAGDAARVPPATPHSLRRLNDDEVRMRVEIRPALRTEEFVEALFGFDRDGLFDECGFPRPLHGAMIAREFAAEGRPTRPPLVVQRLLFPPLAALGRRRGLRATYGNGSAA
jgi:mannose-6-phosphate isomerase-like protein (cupin superfamily)